MTNGSTKRRARAAAAKLDAAKAESENPNASKISSPSASNKAHSRDQIQSPKHKAYRSFSTTSMEGNFNYSTNNYGGGLSGRGHRAKSSSSGSDSADSGRTMRPLPTFDDIPGNRCTDSEAPVGESPASSTPPVRLINRHYGRVQKNEAMPEETGAPGDILKICDTGAPSTIIHGPPITHNTGSSFSGPGNCCKDDPYPKFKSFNRNSTYAHRYSNSHTSSLASIDTSSSIHGAAACYSLGLINSNGDSNSAFPNNPTSLPTHEHWGGDVSSLANNDEASRTHTTASGVSSIVGSSESYELASNCYVPSLSSALRNPSNAASSLARMSNASSIHATASGSSSAAETGHNDFDDAFEDYGGASWEYRSSDLVPSIRHNDSHGHDMASGSSSAAGPTNSSAHSFNTSFNTSSHNQAQSSTPLHVNGPVSTSSSSQATSNPQSRATGSSSVPAAGNKNINSIRRTAYGKSNSWARSRAYRNGVASRPVSSISATTVSTAEFPPLLPMPSISSGNTDSLPMPLRSSKSDHVNSVGRVVQPVISRILKPVRPIMPAVPIIFKRGVKTATKNAPKAPVAASPSSPVLDPLSIPSMKPVVSAVQISGTTARDYVEAIYGPERTAESEAAYEKIMNGQDVPPEGTEAWYAYMKESGYNVEPKKPNAIESMKQGVNRLIAKASHTSIVTSATSLLDNNKSKANLLSPVGGAVDADSGVLSSGSETVEATEKKKKRKKRKVDKSTNGSRIRRDTKRADARQAAAGVGSDNGENEGEESFLVPVPSDGGDDDSERGTDSNAISDSKSFGENGGALRDDGGQGIEPDSTGVTTSEIAPVASTQLVSHSMDAINQTPVSLNPSASCYQDGSDQNENDPFYAPLSLDTHTHGSINQEKEYARVARQREGPREARLSRNHNLNCSVQVFFEPDYTPVHQKLFGYDKSTLPISRGSGANSSRVQHLSGKLEGTPEVKNSGGTKGLVYRGPQADFKFGDREFVSPVHGGIVKGEEGKSWNMAQASKAPFTGHKISHSKRSGKYKTFEADADGFFETPYQHYPIYDHTPFDDSFNSSTVVGSSFSGNSIKLRDSAPVEDIFTNRPQINGDKSIEYFNQIEKYFKADKDGHWRFRKDQYPLSENMSTSGVGSGSFSRSVYNPLTSLVPQNMAPTFEYKAISAAAAAASKPRQQAGNSRQYSSKAATDIQLHNRRQQLAKHNQVGQSPFFPKTIAEYQAHVKAFGVQKNEEDLERLRAQLETKQAEASGSQAKLMPIFGGNKMDDDLSAVLALATAFAEPTQSTIWKTQPNDGSSKWPSLNERKEYGEARNEKGLERELPPPRVHFITQDHVQWLILQGVDAREAHELLLNRDELSPAGLSYRLEEIREEWGLDEIDYEVKDWCRAIAVMDSARRKAAIKKKNLDFTGWPDHDLLRKTKPLGIGVNFDFRAYKKIGDGQYEYIQTGEKFCKEAPADLDEEELKSKGWGFN